MAATLTPAQQEVLDLLRATGRERPEVAPELRAELRARLDRELGEVVRGLSEPLFAGKAALGRLLACEAHHLDEEAADFTWSIPAARGVVAHKAIQLSVTRREVAPSLVLVDEALQRLADDPDQRVADFLLGLTPAEHADLRGDVNGMVATFRELWPPLERAWQPDVESRRRAELCGGMVVLSGRVDLTLGAPQGLRAGRVVVDLKTGGRHGGHLDDLRFYALLDTLRVGVPPFSVVGYYLDSGTFTAEEVTESVLESAVRRTVAAVGRMVELRAGLRSASRTANPACRWCRLRDDCEVGKQALPDDADE